MVTKWFKPKKKTGWDKDQSAAIRRGHLLRSTPKSMKPHKRYLQAGRRAQALANVTKDGPTKKAAKSDAKYFFDKIKEK